MEKLGLLIGLMLATTALAQTVQTKVTELGGGSYEVQLALPAGAKVANNFITSVTLRDLSLALEIVSSATPVLIGGEQIYKTIKDKGFWAILYKIKSGQLGFVATNASAAFAGKYVACQYKSYNLPSKSADLEVFIKTCRSTKITRSL